MAKPDCNPYDEYMNRRILILAVLFGVLISFGSCVNDDDDSTVSQEWKTYNEQQVRNASSSGYTARPSQSGNGSVYWKSITDFVPGDEPSIDRFPIFTDSVSVRYEGWFFRLDDTKYTFDSTEGDKNGMVLRTRVNGGLIDGFATMLQNMKIDEQAEVCIPYLLGYGTIGSYSSGVQIIPGYTTLWFKIKLLNIYDEKKKEWVKK